MRPALTLLLLGACAGKGPATDGVAADSGAPTDSGTDGGGSDGDTGSPLVTGCQDVADQPVIAGELCATEAACAWSGDQGYGYFGYAAAVGADVDGDGVRDVLVGAPLADGTATDGGAATLLSGGVVRDGGDAAVARLQGGVDGDYLGTSVALVGDVDGDGIGDMWIGTRGHDAGTDMEEAGMAVLVLGSAGGFGDTSDGLPGLVHAASFVGERTYSRVGTDVSGAGDVNGDGLADLLTAGELRTYDAESGAESYGPGRVYLVLGRDAGWATETSLADADLALDGETSTGAMGYALGDAGDLDGDGHADLSFGAPYGGSLKGRAYVVPGGPLVGETNLGLTAVTADGEGSYDAFGWALSTGDVTGDGVDDLVVGAPLNDGAYSGAGTVFLFAGGADFFGGNPEPVASWTGEFDDHQLGIALDANGDLDGDGANELVLGASSANQGLLTKSGKSYVVEGGATTWALDTPVGDSALQVLGAGVEDYMGRASFISDVDGDGKADLVAATGYTNVGGTYDVGTLYLFLGL